MQMTHQWGIFQEAVRALDSMPTELLEAVKDLQGLLPNTEMSVAAARRTAFNEGVCT